jgi:hypothetical protein
VKRLYTAPVPRAGASGAVPVLAAGLDSPAGAVGTIVLAAANGLGSKGTFYKALQTAALSFLSACADTHPAAVHRWASDAGKAVTTASTHKSSASTASGASVTTQDVQRAAIDGVCALISGANAVGPSGAEFEPASAIKGVRAAALSLAVDIGRTAYSALGAGAPSKKIAEATGCQELLLVLQNVAALFATPDGALDIELTSGVGIRLLPPPKLQSYHLEHTTSTRFGCLLETIQKLLAADVAVLGGIKKARGAVAEGHATNVLANLGLDVEECKDAPWHASVRGRIQEAIKRILTPAGFGDTELLRGLVLALVESVRACMRVVCPIKVAATVLSLVLGLSRASISTHALLGARPELHAFGFVASMFGA